MERQNDWQLYALRDYFREYCASDRSSNVEESNRTLSVLDETEANEVGGFEPRDSLVAGSVWGDIYRN